MKDSVLLTTIDQRGVARLTLNRPALRNAFDEELIGAICDAMGKLNADPSIRAIILTGAGETFSGGADLNMMRRAADYSAAENKDDARRLAHMLNSIYQSPKPTIARINGPAIGGAVGIIAACDIAVATEDAFMALTEVRVGLIPGVISPFVVRAIGPRQARRYFLTGERIDAETAKRIGLIHMITMGAQLEATVDGVIENILRGAPDAQGEAKSLIKAVAFQPLNDSITEETVAWIARIRATPEGKEGLEAFLEKRKPSWILDTDS